MQCYNSLLASFYVLTLIHAACVIGTVTTTFFLRGNNLLDQDMRAHTSFIKDFAPMPGRSVVAGLRANF